MTNPNTLAEADRLLWLLNKERLHKLEAQRINLQLQLQLLQKEADAALALDTAHCKHLESEYGLTNLDTFDTTTGLITRAK